MPIEDVNDIQEKVQVGNSPANWPMGMKLVVNTQPTEKAVDHRRGGVDVVSAELTIQGEGPFYGFAAVFVRLAGCNLQCPACDTDYTSNRTEHSPPALVGRIQAIMPAGLVVITGGEPFRQNITPFVKLLLNTGYEVQIETNGCYYHPGFPYRRVTIVCSPKTPKIHPELAARITYYKYVLDANHIDPDDGLPTSVLGMTHPPARPLVLPDQQPVIFVQPMDAKDEKKTMENMDAAVRSVFQYGYRLSLQVHKIIGLP